MRLLGLLRTTGVRPRRGARGFAGSEAGSVTVLGLVIFVIILMAAGMAIDVMRYEQRRVHLQSTADRATLAAGNLRQPKDPIAVVEEYFAKEGLSEYLTGVTVDAGLNFRRVEVQTASMVPSLFMRLIGINSLTARADSAAEERYTKVEVSLVLDLSGSMNSFSRIQNLRVAGPEFVETLFSNADPGQISLSVIPYNGQVNVGPVLLSRYNVDFAQPYSYCVDFHEDDYLTMALSDVVPLRGAGHFDDFSTATGLTATASQFFCPTAPFVNNAHIVPFSGNPEYLSTYIANMSANGNTSIEIGMKWAAALLDPGTRPVVEGLIAAGDVHPSYSGRPYDFDQEDVLKVVVVMTDGENWNERIMRDEFKVGATSLDKGNMTVSGVNLATGIWINRSDNRLSTRFVVDQNLRNLHTVLSTLPIGTEVWWVPHRSGDARWQMHPWGASSTSTCAATCTVTINWGTSELLTWEELWSRRSVYWVAHQMFAIPLTSTTSARNTLRSNIHNHVRLVRQPAAKNVRLSNICAAIRDEGVQIFAVAFEAPTNGKAAMEDCASSNAHYFDVAGTNITTAFRAIAGTINRLRLVQ